MWQEFMKTQKSGGNSLIPPSSEFTGGKMVRDNDDEHFNSQLFVSLKLLLFTSVAKSSITASVYPPVSSLEGWLGEVGGRVWYGIRWWG